MEWALDLDRGGLPIRQTGCTEQRPQSITTGKRAYDAFDSGNQAEALAIQTKLVRHDGSPRVGLTRDILRGCSAQASYPLKLWIILWMEGGCPPPLQTCRARYRSVQKPCNGELS
ncbi:hypothetical protein PsSCT_19240 [Pseudomonas sp. SCT]